MDLHNIGGYSYVCVTTNPSDFQVKIQDVPKIVVNNADTSKELDNTRVRKYNI